MYIYQKLAHHIIAYFGLEFSVRRDLKIKENYSSHLQKGLKSHLVSTTSKVFGTINLRRLIREYLESHLLLSHHQSLGTQAHLKHWQDSGSHSTISSSLINASDISDITLLTTKAFDTGHLLWCRYCYCLRIKDLTFAIWSLCKYTLKVVVCMILTSEGICSQIYGRKLFSKAKALKTW